MKRSRFTLEQIHEAIARFDRGEKVMDICRPLGISFSLFYEWKRKYRGLDFQQITDVATLRKENSVLQRRLEILQRLVKFYQERGEGSGQEQEQEDEQDHGRESQSA